jgi:predicted aspartyl protease
MFRIFALVLLLALPVSVFSNAVASSTSITDKRSSSLSFDSANNLIVITATLNGKGPFRFLLDTGATDHVIKPEVAQALGLKVEGGGAIDAGARQKISAGLVRVAEVRIGSFTLERQRFFVTPLPASYPFEGFLGAEFFKSFIVSIDFRQSLITLIRPSAFRYHGSGISLPLKFHEGLIPQVKGEVDDNDGWFKLDTGYNGSLALFRNFIEQHKLLAKYSPQKTSSGGQTVTGEVADSAVAQIRRLKLGDLTINNVLTSFSLDKEGSNSAFSGAIGILILKQFNIIIDYNRQRVILEREASASTQ